MKDFECTTFMGNPFSIMLAHKGMAQLHHESNTCATQQRSSLIEFKNMACLTTDQIHTR